VDVLAGAIGEERSAADDRLPRIAGELRDLRVGADGAVLEASFEPATFRASGTHASFPGTLIIANTGERSSGRVEVEFYESRCDRRGKSRQIASDRVNSDEPLHPAHRQTRRAPASWTESRVWGGRRQL
jgi:hypothetical protein